MEKQCGTGKGRGTGADIHVDYAAFDVPDEWIVGYRLDDAGRYRGLPYLGVIAGRR